MITKRVTFCLFCIQILNKVLCESKQIDTKKDT